MSHGGPAEASPDDLHALGVELILAAFATARASGRSDWQRMTSAVLKNRMLDVTHRRFDETRWGAETFSQFLEQFTDTIVLDTSTHPPTVELRSSTAIESVESPPPSEVELPAQPKPPPSEVERPSRLVREDLWRAVLDYASGVTYVWDGTRAVGVEDATQAEGAPRLPTATQDLVRSWRADFVQTQTVGGTANVFTHAVVAWQEGNLSTAALPPRLRGPWNGMLKRKVLERLEQWFEQESIVVPDDLVQAKTALSESNDSTDRLRQLVLRCVEQMTREELERLLLPSSALLRIPR